MKKTTTLLFSIVSIISFGQFSTSILDYNNVAATVTDGGILFNNLTTSTPGYEVPKGSGMNAIYAAAFWFGAEDANGQLRLSATHYGPNQDIFPGPVANPGEYTSAAYTNNYLTSIWTVTKTDIDNHILNWNQPGYVLPSSIVNWPGNGEVSIGVAEQLAPYVDMNGNNIYEPAQGDYPNIRGDIATYTIMNDVAQSHTATNTDSLGIEVHLMLYQFVTSDYLNNVTFINARIFNRGTETYPNFKTSMFADADLGNYADDYYGCDSVLNMMYTYNADMLDEDNAGLFGYGIDPPAIGIMTLNQPMSGSCFYSSGGAGPLNDPSTGVGHWNFMNNLWGDGTPWVYGGTGFPGSPGSTTSPTNYIMGGDPLVQSQWSEVSTDLGGTGNPPGDRRMLMNLPVSVFQPGDQICYDFAVVYGRAVGTYASVQELKNNAASCQSFFDGQNYGCDQVVLSIGELEKELSFTTYPNPSSGTVHVKFEEIIDDFTISIIDLSGRTLIKNNYQNKDYVMLDLNNSPGVYLLRVETSNGFNLERIVIE